MHYVSVEGLTKAYGIKPLFENLSFHISEGDKIALVARNGAGKSTLMKIIDGTEMPDAGKVWIHKDVDVALFEQEPKLPLESTVLNAIFSHNHPIIETIKKYEAALETGDAASITTLLQQMDDVGAWDFEAKVKQIFGKLNIHQLQQK